MLSIGRFLLDTFHRIPFTGRFSLADFYWKHWTHWTPPMSLTGLQSDRFCYIVAIAARRWSRPTDWRALSALLMSMLTNCYQFRCSSASSAWFFSLVLRPGSSACLLRNPPLVTSLCSCHIVAGRLPHKHFQWCACLERKSARSRDLTLTI